MLQARSSVFGQRLTRFIGMVDRTDIPKEASEALHIIRSCLGRSVVAVYLFGSWLAGGLRPDSDVDVMVVVNNSLTELTRRRLVEQLMQVSGPISHQTGARPLELTVVLLSEIVPWRYPPKNELVYGEWLRDQFEAGRTPAPSHDPDLAIVLKKVRDRSVALVGPDASSVLEPVPMVDVQRATRDTLSSLIEGIRGDERNVLLTLARMWLMAAEGEIAPKDVAAEWAIIRLDDEHGFLLDLARKGYRGEYEDNWSGKETAVDALAAFMKRSIEKRLAAAGEC
jgi:aminoglycoside 9-adenylyltransferase